MSASGRRTSRPQRGLGLPLGPCACRGRCSESTPLRAGAGADPWGADRRPGAPGTGRPQEVGEDAGCGGAELAALLLPGGLTRGLGSADTQARGNTTNPSAPACGGRVPTPRTPDQPPTEPPANLRGVSHGRTRLPLSRSRGSPCPRRGVRARGGCTSVLNPRA